MKVDKFKIHILFKIAIVMTILISFTLGLFYKDIPQIYCVALGLFRSHQTDEQMISNFKYNKKNFELLIEMIRKDKSVQRVGSDWSNPDTIDKDSLYEYRKMFVKIGIPHGFYASVDENDFRFISSSQGFVTHGSNKSYIFTDEIPDNLVESLDEMSQSEQLFGSGCKIIDEHWYICFEGD